MSSAVGVENGAEGAVLTLLVLVAIGLHLVAPSGSTLSSVIDTPTASRCLVRRRDWSTAADGRLAASYLDHVPAREDDLA